MLPFIKLLALVHWDFLEFSSKIPLFIIFLPKTDEKDHRQEKSVTVYKKNSLVQEVFSWNFVEKLSFGIFLYKKLIGRI